MSSFLAYILRDDDEDDDDDVIVFIEFISF